MFQKIANILSIVSFVMVASMSGGAYFGYKYVTSEQFQTKMMNKVLGKVQGLMPKMLDNSYQGKQVNLSLSLKNELLAL